jgi:hypothetical protein
MQPRVGQRERFEQRLHRPDVRQVDVDLRAVGQDDLQICADVVDLRAYDDRPAEAVGEEPEVSGRERAVERDDRQVAASASVSSRISTLPLSSSRAVSLTGRRRVDQVDDIADRHRAVEIEELLGGAAVVRQDDLEVISRTPCERRRRY